MTTIAETILAEAKAEREAKIRALVEDPRSLWFSDRYPSNQAEWNSFVQVFVDEFRGPIPLGPAGLLAEKVFGPQ